MPQVVNRILAIVTLTMLAPVMLLIAVFVLIESGLPVFFSQNRVGREGKLFRLFKFRSMRQDKAGLPLTASGDPRITRVGRVLRQLKLDELPQLWNVARGDMALVGPRPEVPEFVDAGNQLWRAVLQVRPGITDPVAIAFRNEERILAAAIDPVRYYREVLLPAKLKASLAYLQNRTFRGDLRVILRTVSRALFAAQAGSEELANLAQ